MKVVKHYQCEACKTTFEHPSYAEQCEQEHLSPTDLQIDLITSWQREYEFPTNIIVVSANKSGHAASYQLVDEGSVEDIYPEEENELCVGICMRTLFEMYIDNMT